MHILSLGWTNEIVSDDVFSGYRDIPGNTKGLLSTQKCKSVERMLKSGLRAFKLIKVPSRSLQSNPLKSNSNGHIKDPTKAHVCPKDID